jgi:uncharacterized protein YwgA
VYKGVNKLIAYFKYLGFRFNTSDFDSGFNVQKIAFILKSMGIDVNYRFHLWKQGPYCTLLSDDYYKYNAQFSDSDYIISGDEKKILNRFSKIMDIDQKLLESVSTIILLGLVYSSVGVVINKIKGIKPHLSDIEIIDGQNRAKELLFKDEFLTEELEIK